MRYVQLRAFHYVATLGGFSRAASALRLTQPAISDQVGRLERDYDTALFDRRRRRVALTPTGEQLLVITRRLFDQEAQAQALLQEGREQRGGVLRVMADSAAHIAPFLLRFIGARPGVRMVVSSGNSAQVVESLYRFESDIGVLGELPGRRDFSALHLGSSPIIAFARRDHPMAAHKRVTFADLASVPLVLRESGSRTRASFEQAALRAGVVLQPVIEAEGREAVREIVASGAGIGVVSFAEFDHNGPFVALRIEGFDSGVMDEALICLAARRDSLAVRAFFDTAETWVAEQAPPRH